VETRKDESELAAETVPNEPKVSPRKFLCRDRNDAGKVRFNDFFVAVCGMTTGRWTAFALTAEVHCDASQTLCAEPSSKAFIEASGRTKSRKEYRYGAIVVSRR
jgi:hypothetical protein